MATVTSPPVAKYDAKVREQLAEATSRIRTNDILGGVLVVVAAGLGYVAAMIVADHLLEVPDLVRQLGLVGFVVVLGVLGYRLIVRPFRARVNPLYAAKRVEDATPGAKNSIVNYVDLQDAGLPEAVRAMVGARAAKQFETADPADAADPRRTARAGMVVGVLVVVLAGLFLYVSPARFFSHLGRTLTPFKGIAVASRTTIVLTEPATGDATVTAGMPVQLAVTIGGKLPDPNGPDRVRALIQHAPDQMNPEELPLEPGTTSREWTVRVPDHLVQNGFWYRVVAGDGTTEVHRVTVRSRPTFLAFEARYEYPDYLRLRPEVVPEPQLEGYRGTVVTLTAKANRELSGGRLLVAGQELPIGGDVVGENRDSIRFKLTLTTPGTYRMTFTATTGEENADAPPYSIKVLSDQPPTVAIASPAEEVTLPTTGLLAVDAKIGDDFGIDIVQLRARVNGRSVVKAYREGKSFRRDADGTFPTAVEYKDSIPLSGLKDERGNVVPVKAGDVVEYWVEAKDNCTVPEGNVGKSKVQRVKVAAPPAEPKPQAEQQKQTDERKQTEAGHNQKQDEKLKGEARPAPAQPRPDAAEPPKDEPKQGEPKPGDAKGTDKQPGTEPKPGDPTKPGTEPKPGDPPMPGSEPKKADTPSGTKPNPEPKPPENTPPGSEPKTPDAAQGGSPQPSAEPKKPEDKKSEEMKKEADRVQKEMRKQTNVDRTERALDDLKSDDKEKQQAARDTLDETVGQENRKKAEEATRKSQSDDPGERKDAEKTLEDVRDRARELEQEDVKRDANGRKPGEQDVERLFKDAKDLNSSDPEKRQKAEEKLTKELGKENVDELKKKMKEQPPGGDPKADENTKRDIDQMQKKQSGQPQGGNQQKPVDPKELANAARDLDSKDPAKQKAAQDKLDQMVGKDARQKTEQMMKDLKSDDPKTRADAEKKLDEARKQAGQQGGMTPEQKKEIEDAAKDLASDDKQKQQAARDKLDGMMGKENREKAEQLAKDMKSGDADKKAAAEKQLKEMADKAGGKPSGEPTPEQKKEMLDAAKDLTSPDKGKREAAEKKLDEKIGKDARQQAQQMANDLKSDDKEKRAAAEQKLKDLQQQAAKQAGAPKPDQSPAELAQAAKDMASGDKDKEKAAREKLNDKDRAAAEKAAQDLKDAADKTKADRESGDPDKKAAADKQMADAAKKAADKLTEKPIGKPQTDAEKKDAADRQKAMQDALSNDPKTAQAGKEKLDELDRKKRDEENQTAKEMGSPDPKKQKDAAEKFDQTDLGKKLQDGLKDQAKKAKNDPKVAENLARDLADIQKQMDDLKKNDPKKAEEAMKNLRDLAKKMDRNRGPSGTVDGDVKPLEANKDFTKRSGDLQLTELKKVLGDKKLLERLGYTEADYKRFLDGFTEMVKRDEEQKDATAKKPTDKPTEPRVRVDEATGKVEARKDGTTGGTQGTGAAVAPPGYGDAKKKFTGQPRTPEEKK